MAVCEPQPLRGTSWVEKRRPCLPLAGSLPTSIMTGFVGSVMSKRWTPSKPWPTSVPPQDCVAAPVALVAESHERTRMFP